MFVFKMRRWVSLTIAFILCLTLNDVTEAKDAILIGTVYCDTCFQQHFSQFSHFISGALVAVECRADGGKPRFFHEEVKTDMKGEFKVLLSSEHVDDINRCSVKLISSSEPDCALVHTASSSLVWVKVNTPEYHVFSTGFFTFQPLEQPKRCRWESHVNSNDGIIASTPLPSPVVDGMLAPIPPLTEPNPMELDQLHDLATYERSSYDVNRILSPLLVPSQLPPGFRFIPEAPPPPTSSDSMFNLGFQPPPPAADSVFNTGFQSPPSDSMFNNGFLTPPTDSMLNPNPIQPPIDSTFVPSQPASSTSQVLLTPPRVSPSLPIPSLDQQPPQPPFNPPFPAFPFQPSAGLPRIPPITNKPP